MNDEKLLIQANIRLTESEHVTLRRLARLHGITPSAVLRMLLDRESVAQEETLKQLDVIVSRGRKASIR